MTTTLRPHAIGAPVSRVDGPAKVTGTAPYAYEHPVQNPAYVYPIQATVARGHIAAMDTHAAEALDGVLAVLTHVNAPGVESTEDKELAILRSTSVAFRGQLIGAVIAETSEIARHAADLVSVSYLELPHDVSLRADRDDLYAPDTVNPSHPTDTEQGNVEAALARARVRVEGVYTTPMEHNNPMEPHTTVAKWDSDGLTLYESTQGVHQVRAAIARLFGLDPAQVRVIAPHVGGGFGSKGQPHAPVVLAAMASRLVGGRPVKLALTRQQMFALVGYRTPTIQRIRLGAGVDGRLSALSVDVVEQTSKIKEFAEQTGYPVRSMYAASHRRTTHRLAALDVPVPSWMRAPGECPGMFALEVAMDELAYACGLDPIELRIRNEPEVDPDTGKPFSSRNLIACLREGARRFGWWYRNPAPRTAEVDGWLVGTGVAASTYPARSLPGSEIRISCVGPRRYRVEIGAADIGTGTWTTLTQIAADALGVEVDDIDLRIGDTALPSASVAGGSSGISSWGTTIVDTARRFLDRDPTPGDSITGSMPENPAASRFAMRSFGAQFAEVRVHADTGELRVPRLLGVFAAGRIINPRLARSQLLGGMTMGLSMALHEQSITDPRFGHTINHDLAEYHIATNADIRTIDAIWLPEPDPYVNPLGTKGIGELGIVGTAAAIANAAHHATGLRLRNLPITPDLFL